MSTICKTNLHKVTQNSQRNHFVGLRKYTTKWIYRKQHCTINLQVAVDEFYLAPRAKINWHKSLGFWVSQNSSPTWMPLQEFKWVPNGTTILYLGYQVGLHVNADVFIAPLKPRRKLLCNRFFLKLFGILLLLCCLLGHVFVSATPYSQLRFGRKNRLG